MTEQYRPHRDNGEYDITVYLQPTAAEEIKLFAEDNPNYPLQDCLHEANDCFYCPFTTNCLASPNYKEENN